MNAACDARNIINSGEELGSTMENDTFSFWTTQKPYQPGKQTSEPCRLLGWYQNSNWIFHYQSQFISTSHQKKKPCKNFLGATFLLRFGNTFPGVVCHPIFASFLSYVAELQMEGDGIWDGWSHGPWSPWSIIDIPKDPPFWCRLKIPKVNHWRSQKSIKDPNTYHGCSCTISYLVLMFFLIAIDRW